MNIKGAESDDLVLSLLYCDCYDNVTRQGENSPDYLMTLASASRFQSAPSYSGRMCAAITLDFLGMLTVNTRLGLE